MHKHLDLHPLYPQFKATPHVPYIEAGGAEGLGPLRHCVLYGSLDASRTRGLLLLYLPATHTYAAHTKTYSENTQSPAHHTPPMHTITLSNHGPCMHVNLMSAPNTVCLTTLHLLHTHTHRATMLVIDPAGAATRALSASAVQRCWVDAWQDAQPVDASQQVCTVAVLCCWELQMKPVSDLLVTC